jgi:hypothetical protein
MSLSPITLYYSPLSRFSSFLHSVHLSKTKLPIQYTLPPPLPTPKHPPLHSPHTTRFIPLSHASYNYIYRHISSSLRSSNPLIIISPTMYKHTPMHKQNYSCSFHILPSYTSYEESLQNAYTTPIKQLHNPHTYHLPQLISLPNSHSAVTFLPLLPSFYHTILFITLFLYPNCLTSIPSSHCHLPDSQLTQTPCTP